MKRSLLSVGAWLLVCTTIPAFVTGCGDAAAEREANVGSVSVALTGVGQTGVLYRLRNGVFKITGTSSATASTEDDVSAANIVLELKAGGYLAALAKGWTLEQTQGDGTFKTVKAVLVSTNPAPFQVFDQQTTSVIFQFNAGDDVVQLGNGRAAIGIAVNDCGMSCNQDKDMDGFPANIDCDDNDPKVSPGAPEQCFNMIDDNCDGQIDEGCNNNCMPGSPELCGDGVDNNCDGQVDEGCCAAGDPTCTQACLIDQQLGCPAGLACYLTETFDSTLCAAPGPVPLGQPCSLQTDCQASAVCAQIQGPTPTCTQVCDPNGMSACPGGTTCSATNVSLPNEVLGICF
jgi:Putative metal-binding motif